MVSDNGVDFLLDLPEVRLLRDGDGLELSDGRVIEVKSAPEKLYAIYATDARHLTILAWHIGNRHLAAQIFKNRIHIRRDHVIREMLKSLGARVEEISAPFDPEGGAYGARLQNHHHSHDET